MSRNARMMLVVGVAVVTATLASFGVFLAIKTRPLPPAPRNVDVVVATRDVVPGILLTREDLQIVPWPESVPISGHFSTIDDEIVGRGLVVGVLKNEPITASKLSEKGVPPGLSSLIRAGMRAMSVRVNEVIGVAGFVTPGTRVDVLVTLSQGGGGLSRTVVENVEVLAAGTRYDDAESKRQGKPIPSTVVTLMVSPEDAERIALAASEGQITLALRYPLDDKTVPTNGVRIADLVSSRAPAPVPTTPAVRGRPAPPAPRPAPCSIESFKGGKREVMPCL
jgi:pilus assembly protein CpaB